MFESTGVLKTALWRPTVFLELQSSGTTSRLSPKIGPVIGLSVAVGCQLSGGPENHPGERDHFASESEMSPQIGLNGAVGGPRSGGLPEAPEEGERDHFASESEMSPQIGLNGAVSGPRSGGLPEAPEEAYSRGFAPWPGHVGSGLPGTVTGQACSTRPLPAYSSSSRPAGPGHTQPPPPPPLLQGPATPSLLLLLRSCRARPLPGCSRPAALGPAMPTALEEGACQQAALLRFISEYRASNDKAVS
ncbi:unnamed protein product [Boreogadus saida]